MGGDSKTNQSLTTVSACFQQNKQRRLIKKQRFTLYNQAAAAEMYFKVFTLENGVIYSHIFITLQAAILPAKKL